MLAPQARAQSTQQAGDGGWPRGYSLPSEAQIIVFQPQVSSWDDQKHMVALAAVSYVPKGDEKPTLGTIKIEADTSVALQERLVKFTTLKITEAKFQTLSKDQTSEITTAIENTIPEKERIIGLDRVLTQMGNSQIIPKNVEGLKADLPQIFLAGSGRYFSVLMATRYLHKRQRVAVCGYNESGPLESPRNNLLISVSTRHGSKQRTGKGPWTLAGKLPDSFKQIPADDNWKDVVLNLPGKPLTTVPHVYFSSAPAELIQIDGAPKLFRFPEPACFG